jgi:hypothetical protein
MHSKVRACVNVCACVRMLWVSEYRTMLASTRLCNNSTHVKSLCALNSY